MHFCVWFVVDSGTCMGIFFVTHGLSFFVSGHSDFLFRRSCIKKVIYEKTFTRQVYVFVIGSVNFWCGLLLALPLRWTFFFVPYGLPLFVFGRHDFPFTRLCRKQFRQGKLSWSLHQIRTTIFLLG